MNILNRINFFKIAGTGTKEELNETFIYLIRAAEEEKSVRETLLKILTLAPRSRKAAITKLIADLKFQKAPSDFIEAIAYLLDDQIADSALSKIQCVT
ncbi:MAG: hypothetical protein ACFHVJ_08785 [Aestuariibacter sp.]